MSDWIEWTGGECPIPDAKAGEYEIERRNGDQGIPLCDANSADWLHEEDVFFEYDITAYRLIEKEQSDLDWLEEEVKEMRTVAFSKVPSGHDSGLYEAYGDVLDLIKERRKAKS